MKIGKYTVSFRRGTPINGMRGYDYEIYERLASSGVDVYVRGGWTAGNRRDAEQEATNAIRKLEMKAAS